VEILLTNDDGFLSPGITLFAAALREAGHRVLVLAPDVNRSGVSHAISYFDKPCMLSRLNDDTWSCSGTPVDCVILALLGGVTGYEKFVPDMVISGINRGANLGTDITYSGTASAARQASLVGFPGFAFSLVEDGDTWYWESAIKFIIDKLNEIKDFWKPQTFINVNIPNNINAPRGLTPAFPSKRCYNDSINRYVTTSGEVYCFPLCGKIESEPETGSDHDVICCNFASMSAIYMHPAAIEEVNVGKVRL